jgi:hypothetical protein
VDIADAYHTAAFARCWQGIITKVVIWIDQHGTAHVLEQRFLGCSPRTCPGACDKSLSRICTGCVIFLFACCQFWKATAHGPLNSYILSLIRLTLHHPISLADPAGLGGRSPGELGSILGLCPVCTKNLAAATAQYQRFLHLCRQLGLSLSPGKGFSPAQHGEFTGLHLCTVTSVITVPATKLAGILEFLCALLSLESVPRRAIARAQGKIVQYSSAIPYLGAVTPAFSHLTSCWDDSRHVWDVVVQLTPECSSRQLLYQHHRILLSPKGSYRQG